MSERFTPEETQIIDQRNVFGLTGGMGSGKSTVSSELALRGANIVDADLIVRKIQSPGEPGLNGMVDVLGDDILMDNGELDRKVAAKKMFSDDDTRKNVMEVLGPLIKNEIFDQTSRYDPDDLVVLDIPLLLEAGWNKLPLKGIMVVNTPKNIAIARLVEFRGFSKEEAEARLSTQMSNEKRLDYADLIIDNDSDKQWLSKEIDIAWKWMNTIRDLGRVSLKIWGNIQ
jgi:dephospho-CoA kinase